MRMGAMLLASLEGQPVAEIVERDDGFIAASRFGTAFYLAPFAAGRRTTAPGCAMRVAAFSTLVGGRSRAPPPGARSGGDRDR
jgi:hypothetical protein